uniref:TPR repeat-containing thioredoxin TDX n=2 Tax=Kalanchoe fedtschenkoi TaxID=63787 RepID=A0A7N0VAD5_KALFE
MDSSGWRVEEVKALVEECRSKPSILHTPSLSFFKSYLQSLGARIPSEERLDDLKYTNMKMEDEIIESDLELDESEVVKPDNDPPQKMGDPSIDVTDENRDAAQALKSKATDAISEGRFDEAINFLTEAIMLNPTSAILYATRASVFTKLKKPNAAINDAEAALQINPDSAKGYKVRGLARAMLGLWREAANDLHKASNLDFDEEIGLVLKKVEPNVKKIEEHRKKYEILRREEEQKKAEWDKKQHQAEEESKAAALLKDGEVIGIHSTGDLSIFLKAASMTSRVAVLYFTATWCGPCRMMSPHYTSLARKHPKVVFLKVDIDEAVEVARQWNISSVPTFVFLKNCKEVDKVVGADKIALERKIAQYGY